MADKTSVKLNRTLRDRKHKRLCEKRTQQRLLCSDLVQMSWRNEAGLRSSEVVILENLSPMGVGLFAGVPLPPDVALEISANAVVLRGVVRQCQFRENGYIIGIELDADSKWAQDPKSGFLPQHLLDVSRLDLG